MLKQYKFQYRTCLSLRENADINSLATINGNLENLSSVVINESKFMNNYADYDIDTNEPGISIYANINHGEMIILNSLF